MLKRNLFGKLEQGFSFLVALLHYFCGIGKVPDHHLFNVVNKNVFPWLFANLDFTWVKILYIDHVIKKVVSTIFSINFFTQLILILVW